MEIAIGIDPGTHTGVAVWDCKAGEFLDIRTLPLHRALDLVREWRSRKDVASLHVVFEDARRRRWFGRGDASAKAQGAGSVKRDSSIWEDFLRDEGIPFVARAPKDSTTKMGADLFRRITGYGKTTSEHGRDAALLVFGASGRPLLLTNDRPISTR